jgi:hypothetical protein
MCCEAQVRSRFAAGNDGGNGGGSKAEQDLQPFIRCLGRLGFQVQTLDARTNTMFFVAVLRKVNTCPDPTRIQWPELKACVYKKR